MEREVVFNELDDLLNRICVKLQLNKTRRERVENSYKALCEFINSSEGYFSKYDRIDFYPQGSYRIQTTVKPKGKDEFDLDFILEIKGEWTTEDPMKLLKELYKLFRDSGIYRDKVELKNRCVRINYENDFHIDILPSFSAKASLNNTNIKVPDRELRDWTDSNPKGYGDWFNEKANLVDRVLLEKRFSASIEELPRDKPYELINPLNKVVQLIKRYRDIYYKDKESNGVRSIIITTLCAEFYDGDASEYASIAKIINSISEHISNSSKILEVYNPVNPNEKFSEKWDTDKEEYNEFCDFILGFKKIWFEMVALNGVPEKIKKLEELFGESIVKDSLREQAEYVKSLRENKSLKISTINGALILNRINNCGSYKSIESHTFYGE